MSNTFHLNLNRCLNKNIMEPKQKKQRKSWTLEDEELLIELWADKLSELRGQRKNNHVYKEMSFIMGGVYTPEEIKVKLHNLTNRYRKEKKKMGPSGGSPSEWILFFRVHAVLGNLKINNLEEIVEDSIMEPFSFALSPTSSPSRIEATPTSEVDHSVPSSDEPTTSTPACSTATKKRKRTKNREELEKFDEIISDNLKIIKDADDRMIKVEERRNDILERIALSCETVQKEIFNLLHEKNN